MRQEVIYDFLGDQYESGRLNVMLQPQLEAPGLHLERARDYAGGTSTAWCADYGQGEYPARGGWWRESQKSIKPSKLPEIHENGEKTGGFIHLMAYKLAKNAVFCLKGLNKYNHETFFEAYINFKNSHYLSHCRVIPLQSFRSDIRPQPSGLGLIL